MTDLEKALERWEKYRPVLSDGARDDLQPIVDAARRQLNLTSPETIESLPDAIEVLKHGRQTHVQWIDYLENENPDFDTEHVGDVDHHRWYLKAYDVAIPVLEAVLRSVEEGTE